MSIRDQINALRARGGLTVASRKAGIRGLRHQAHADSIPAIPFSWTNKGTSYTVTKFDRHPFDGAPMVWLEVRRAGKSVVTDSGGYVFHNAPIMVADPAGIEVRPEAMVGTAVVPARVIREDPAAALKQMIEQVIELTTNDS